MDTITWPLPKNVRFYRMIIISCMTLPNIAKLTAYKSTKKWWPSYSLHKKASENGAHIFMGRTAFASNNSIKRRGSSWLAWCILKVGPPAEPIMVSVNRACRLAITDSASSWNPIILSCLCKSFEYRLCTRINELIYSYLCPITKERDWRIKHLV